MTLTAGKATLLRGVAKWKVRYIKEVWNTASVTPVDKGITTSEGCIDLIVVAVEVREFKWETLVLTDDGKKYAAEGSPEIHFFSAIPEEGSISKDDLELDPSVSKIGSTQAAKKRWVEMEKQVSRKESLLQVQQGLVCLFRTIMGWTGYSDVEKAGKSWNSRSITSMLRDNLLMLAISIPFSRYSGVVEIVYFKRNVSASLSFCPSDQQSFMSELDSQVPTAFDLFADANVEDSCAGTKEYIHIRVQQRNGRKSLTTVQGLKKEYIYRNIHKDLKKEVCCNGTLVHDSELGQVHVFYSKILKDLKKEFCCNSTLVANTIIAYK
ncbi:hypothetical protein IGI04_023053 [Brassica rapa subsp. trilocularis]|uniref:SUI1 domain-containing protein n=1 Tax=Brassica rapa subsp. trilocularis TaxID=1813537 RepID=A0ABQ7M2Q1_BRACM|nr:hypothetical protein IGI04_023053 [Brassica rapa subsp. trilocularis]